MAGTIIFGSGPLAEIAINIAQKNLIPITALIDEFQEPGTKFGLELFRSIEAYTSHAGQGDTNAFVAIGDNKSRQNVAIRLAKSGIGLVNIIDPAAVIEPSASIGTGNLIMATAYIGVGNRVGDGNLIFPGAILAHHNQVGSFNFFSPNAVLAGFSEVGNLSKLGINSTARPYQKFSSNLEIQPGAVFPPAFN